MWPDCAWGKSAEAQMLVAGNSYIESPSGTPTTDQLLEISHYQRTRQQQLDLGLLADNESLQQQQNKQAEVLT